MCLTVPGRYGMGVARDFSPVADTSNLQKFEFEV